MIYCGNRFVVERGQGTVAPCEERIENYSSKKIVEEKYLWNNLSYCIFYALIMCIDSVWIFPMALLKNI
jgi:hypothetical protein